MYTEQICQSPEPEGIADHTKDRRVKEQRPVVDVGRDDEKEAASAPESHQMALANPTCVADARMGQK